jgi:hypothetical protein
MGKHRNRKGSDVLRLALRIFIFLLIFSTKPSRSVDADELARRATWVERTRTTVVDRVSVRFRPIGGGDAISIAYEPGSKAASASASAGTGAGAPAGIPPAIAVKLRAAGFDWSNPLGMQLPNAFRVAHVLDKTERVDCRLSAGLCVLATSAPESAGELSEIEVTFNDEAGHVVHLALVFRDLGRLEIGELTRRAASYLPASNAAPITTTTTAIATTAVTVNTPITPRRPTRGTVMDSVPAAARTGLLRWRNRSFGGGTPEHRAFLPALTRSIAIVRQRLADLADLTEREQLRVQQYRELRAELNNSQKMMSTLVASVPAGVDPAAQRQLGRTLTNDSETTPDHLIDRAPAALARAEELQQLVLKLLAQDDLTPDDQRQANAAFAALWEAVYGPATH